MARPTVTFEEVRKGQKHEVIIESFENSKILNKIVYGFSTKSLAPRRWDQYGYIDVGDGCWRPNVLVTSLRCWWPLQDVGDRFNTLEKSPT